MTRRVIIAGTDGTVSSTSAVRWAAAEAQRRGLPLRIVHAFDWDWNGTRFDIGSEYIDVARQLAEAVVADACRHARQVAPDVNISADTLTGHAVPRLLEVSQGAELLVLGNRGRGGFAGLLLGSVSQRMATRAQCPVIVVRGHTDPDGPVVAGVDDTSAADQVLTDAFHIAAERGCPLTVVHSQLPPVPLWVTDIPPATMIINPEHDTADRARLEQRLAPWREKFPDVPVETVLTYDSAASRLVEASRGAQLVVVGGGHSGTLTGTLLGSTVTQLLHHADCPILITRYHADDEAAR